MRLVRYDLIRLSNDDDEEGSEEEGVDEGDGFGGDAGVKRLGLGPAAPVQVEQLAMPAEDCVRLDDTARRQPC